MSDNIIYSCNNVEAMVNSVKANGDIINNMLKYTKSNDKEINNILSDYAKVKKILATNKLICIELMLKIKKILKQH